MTIDKEIYNRSVKCDCLSDVVTEIEFKGADMITFELIEFKEAKQINSLIFDGNMTFEFWNNCFQCLTNLTKIDFMKSKVSNIGKFTIAIVRITEIHILSMWILYNNALTKMSIYRATNIANDALKD